MDHDEHARRASSFGAEAVAYAEHRPDYPDAAVDWGLAPVLGDGTALTVLDLAAGTGKLTGGLLTSAAIGTVIAVEPDDAMRAELSRRHPAVNALAGTAEAIPLPDASVDAVFAGQAMHWFDLDRALPEICRVLRGPGVFVPMWNTYDDRVPWMAEYARLSGSIGWSDARANATNGMLEAIGTVELAEFPHQHRRTAHELVATTATHSDLLILPEAERAAKLAQLREYLLATPETANGPFDTPLVTRVVRLVPRGR